MIALITARGGSKGLPRKNVLPLCGKPLIAYTIEAANQCPSIDRTIVSTDDSDIADIALKFCAEVPFMRPEHLATDSASSRDVILHALDSIESEGAAIDDFCLLQPTSPLRTSEDIENAIQIFYQKEAASVLSVVEYEHPVQWAMHLDENGRLIQRENAPAGLRQELETVYRPNGAIYVFKTSFFKTVESYIGPTSFPYIMPPERSVDIDTQLDFLLAETVKSFYEV